jgi:hypothetical protein
LLSASFIQFIFNHLPKLSQTIVNNWWGCLEGIFGFNAITVKYFFGNRVGINTVDAFVQIPALSFDGWIKVKGEPRRFPLAVRGQFGDVSMPGTCSNNMKSLC